VYQYYDLTFNTGYKLTYKLEQHRPAQVWAGLMSKASVNNLRKNLNPWQDFDKNLLTLKISNLENVAKLMNEWLPNKIHEKWDYNNHQQSVNKFHIHFPEQEKNETDIIRKSQLSEYNDLIHEIEVLITGYGKKQIPYLLICPDDYPTIPLIDDDFLHFKAVRKFGELCLHYCHVGRHPFELFSAYDTECPVDQIIPQKFISTYHTCRFYNDDTMEHWITPKFKKFYEVSTLQQVVNFNDPKMAFGYIPIGQLLTTETDATVLNKVKNSNKIIAWKVYT
jgi:hypothetical protein